ERGELAVGDRTLDDRRLEPELDECLDIRADGAREAPDLGVEPGTEDEGDRPRVVVRHAWEARLDAVDARGRERSCNLHFLLWRKYDSNCLLAIAECRVVEADRHARLSLERLRVE